MTHDQLPVGGGVLQLPLRLEQKRLAGSIELPGPLVARSRADRGGNVAHGEPERGELGWRDLDAHRGLRTEDIHLGDARQDAQALGHLAARIIVKLPLRQRFAGHCEIDNRLVVRIGLRKNRRRRQVHRQAGSRLVDGRLHVGRRGIDALAQVKLQGESRAALRALRGHQREPGNLHELAFERSGHVAGHGRRARARVVHAHGDHREIDRRQIVHRQALKTDDAEDDDAQREHHRHDRTFDEGIG